MENLSLLINRVRVAQGISQTDIAKALGISQAAINQFEKLKATLSEKTLRKMSPLLNLNPDFIESGTGNPFKQRNSHEVIKMFIHEDPFGVIDLSIFNLIAQYNNNAIFLFLRPPHFYRSKPFKSFHRRDLRCALIVKDSDNNIFFFRKKEDDDFFSESELKKHLRFMAFKGKKYFVIDAAGISKSLYERIENWSLTIGEVNRLMNEMIYRVNREFLIKLINKTWSHQTMVEYEEEYKNIRKKIEKMDNEMLDHYLIKIIPKFAKIIKDNII